MPAKSIPLMVPDIQEPDIEEVVKVLRSGMLVQGERVEALEKSIANYVGVKHAVAISNGTASLHLALVAYGIGRGDEVILPALSYVATANVIELVGAKPVFVDINLETFNIDVEQIESKITERTKAIIPVHEFGLTCDIEGVLEISEKYKLKTIEDAACALGATANKRFAGSFGHVGSFSFHPRKAITGGEGGVLVTNDDQLAEAFRVLRNHGISQENGKMKFVAAGFNYRLTEAQAALINSQLKRLEDILATKDELSKIYLDRLGDVPQIKLPSKPKGRRHTWQSFHVVLDNSINRDALIETLRGSGIGTNYGAQCIPFLDFYQNKYKLNCEELFPNALLAFKQGLVLPLYERLISEDLIRVASTVTNCVRNA